jgi:hypothetical protein
MLSQPGKFLPSSPGRISLDFLLRRLLLASFCFICLAATQVHAQSIPSSAAQPDHLSGTVVNAVTHEPIARALVYSPDNRYAVMTDDRGRFEFQFPHTDPESAPQNSSFSVVTSFGTTQLTGPNPNRPSQLMARKPGFVPRNNGEDQVQLVPEQQEVTLTLMPGAKIVGHVNIPGEDGSDNVQVSLYRRQIQEGHARWQPAGNATARSDGEFRFAELLPGSYKLFTNEVPDSDPLASSRRARRLQRPVSNLGGQSFGYPPVYYPAASDFGTAGIIVLSPGETFQANLAPKRREYYAVKLPVANAAANGGNVEVWSQGHAGPGYTLGFNAQDSAVEGMLPNGSYTVRLSAYGQQGLVGMGVSNITISGGPVSGPAVTVLPNTAIAVNVRKEFQNQPGQAIEAQPLVPLVQKQNTDDADAPVEQNTRRPNYLQVTLQSDDEFNSSPNAWLRPPKNSNDDSLVIENVFPGRYRVQATSSIGFVASVVSGGTDLRREPLVVGPGATLPPIEITVRDDGAQIDGTAVAPSDPAHSGASPQGIAGTVYFIPVSNGGGAFTQTWLSQEGAFHVEQLPPGEYRVLAFDRQQPDLEYERDEVLSRFDSRSQVIRATAGEKQHVRVPLITAAETAGTD